MSEPRYIFTKTGTKGHQTMTAHKTPISHTPMLRWVNCYLVGDDLVIPGDPNHRDPHGPEYERLSEEGSG